MPTGQIMCECADWTTNKNGRCNACQFQDEIEKENQGLIK